MSRQFKPRPNNKFTERYREELDNIGENDINEFIEHQRLIADNIIVLDDALSKGFLLDFKENSLYDPEMKPGLWSPNIGYGGDDWPVDEWGYQLVTPASDKWVESPMMEAGKELWEKCKKIFKKEFDLKPSLHGAHMNATMFGMESKIHNDSPDGTEAFIILFLNDDMNAYDGGELQTYINMNPDLNVNKDFCESETDMSINPKIGRMVIADSRILHRGLAPTRFYGKARMTAVFKMKFKDRTDAWEKLDFKW